MKLFFSSTSPYVRKVMACAHELGVADRITLLPSNAHPVTRDAGIIAHNPLDRVTDADGMLALARLASHVYGEHLGRWADWQQGQLDKVHTSLLALERAPQPLHERADIGTLALAASAQGDAAARAQAVQAAQAAFEALPADDQAACRKTMDALRAALDGPLVVVSHGLVIRALLGPHVGVPCLLYTSDAADE